MIIRITAAQVDPVSGMKFQRAKEVDTDLLDTMHKPLLYLWADMEWCRTKVAEDVKQFNTAGPKGKLP